jgi:hypothetical protein
MLKEYAPTVFSNLNDFQIARKRLQEEQSKILCLGDVIIQHQLQQQVGICLLHKHFEMTPDEKLVEQIEGDRSFAKPVKHTEKVNAVPYMWKAQEDLVLSDYVFYPLEFVDSADTESWTAVIQNKSFLSDIAKALSDLNVIDLFGVSILHRDHIKLAEGETVIETSNEKKRKLNFAAVSRSSISPKIEVTQTLWSFSKLGDGRCGGHSCSGHLDCEGHCYAHETTTCGMHGPEDDDDDDDNSDW